MFKERWIDLKNANLKVNGNSPGCPVVRTSCVGAGSIPDQGAKIPYASQPENWNIKQKQYFNKFNKDFKNGPHQKNLKKSVSG